MTRLARPLLLLPLLFLALFYVWPLLSILVLGLAPDGALALEQLWQLVSPWHLNVLAFTIVQALLSTVITIALALPAAWVCVRWSFPGRSMLLSLSTLAFVLPTVVVAAAISALIGSRGLVNDLLRHLLALDGVPLRLEGTLAIILIAHVFYNFAVALRIITGYWANRSTMHEDAARVLGAQGWRLWWEVRLPLLRPALLAAATLIFIFTFTSFGVIVILGELRFSTLEVEIYLQAVNLFNLPVAAGLSIVQITLMFVLMLVYSRLRQRLPIALRAAQAPRPQGWRQWLAVCAAGGFMLVLLAAPLLALVIRSLSGAEGLTGAWYAALSQDVRGSVLFVPPVQAVGNSLFFALCTTAIALVLGLLAASLMQRRNRRWLDPLFMLPLATSAVTLGFGFIVALDEPPLDLRASPLLIPIAHTLVALPFVVRSILPSLDSISPSLRESASVLGATPWQVWRQIDLPLVSRGLMVGAIFAFTISMGEFGASLFIARPANATIPVVIYRLLGQPGTMNMGQAMAMSVILLLTCSLGFVVIERVQRAGSGAF
ncbi:MAG: iron ABC transporter permease [Anaerolineae bacterium]|nr:iron ABC transporter permease [Anaerolineae bacterium]